MTRGDCILSVGGWRKKRGFERGPQSDEDEQRDTETEGEPQRQRKSAKKV